MGSFRDAFRWGRRDDNGRTVRRRGTRATLLIAFAIDPTAVRLDINLKNIRFFITGKGEIRKAAVGTRTGLPLKLMAFFDDGKFRTLSTSVTTAPLLLSTGAIRCLCRLLFYGLRCGTCFALFAKEAMPEIANQRFFLLKFFLETRFPFTRPLMLSFPIMTFPFKPSQLFLCDRHQIECRNHRRGPTRGW